MDIDLKKEIKMKIGSKALSLKSTVDLMNNILPPDKQTTPQYINNKLTRGSFRYSEAMIMAEAIGMEIVWVDKNKR